MPDFDNDHLKMVEECEFNESLLNDWECDFIDSIRNQIDEGRNLSERQIEKLEDIWEKVTENA
ncbi:hypothetical protein Nit79A3_1385 [Nitrosomonas sp. Is79A3]|uniref:hypothetical protein n=1 Tax=Nitrosomonas sp. (strain Is79A3) TaxID=261292 RepID=UPI000215CEF4